MMAGEIRAGKSVFRTLHTITPKVGQIFSFLFISYN